MFQSKWSLIKTGPNHDTSDEWILSRTGIKQRHISKQSLPSDLATEVAESLLIKAGF